MDLKVFTLNCWGIKYVSKNRQDRMRAIAEELAAGKYDVVCLQEVWVTSDFDLIRSKVSGVLPYSHYFYSGVGGSGVCVLTRYPIEEVFFHQWSINGYMHKVHHGDWFGGKGVGLCQIKVDDLLVNVYSAHLHAEYNKDCDEYLVHRILQAYDTAQFIQQSSASADLVILAGDLNTEPTDLAYRIITTVAGLHDSFTRAGEVPENMITTNESLINTYTPRSKKLKNIPGVRIDYVMYHPGKHVNVSVDKYELPLTDLVPGKTFSYSDHEAVCVTLRLERTLEKNKRAFCTTKVKVLEESIDICKDGLKRLDTHRFLYLVLSFLLFSILIASLCITLPYGYTTLYFIFKALLIVTMLYSLLMGTLWNCIEKHAVMACIGAMEVSVKRYPKSLNTKVPRTSKRFSLCPRSKANICIGESFGDLLSHSTHQDFQPIKFQIMETLSRHYLPVFPHTR